MGRPLYFAAVVSIFFFLFFLACSQWSQSGCLPYFHTWCGLSANLECRSEMCCTQLAGNTECKNYAKYRRLHTIAQLCRAISSQLTHVSTIVRKWLNSNMCSICPHNMVNFGPLTAESSWWVWGTPANFNGLRVLTLLLQRWCSKEVNQTLHDIWPSLGTLYIHSWGLLPPNGILPGAKFTLRPSLAFSYIGSITGWHSSSGCQPNFVEWYKEWNYRTFAPHHFQQTAPPIFCGRPSRWA